MALAEDQKQRVLYHLNIPGLSIVEGSRFFNSVINDRLNEITEEMQEIVEEELDCLEEAEDALKEAKKCLKVSAVGDIKINTDHLHNLKYEYNRLVSKLSSTLCIPRRNTGNQTGLRV